MANYKESLQGNNIDLQTILNSINELPEEKSLADLTSDADATASDIASGKTAYVDGELVTGSVSEYTNNDTVSFDFESIWMQGDNICVESEALVNDSIYREGVKIEIDIPSSGFGDATVADVAAGKTFTSAEGFQMTGEAEIGGIEIEYTSVSGATTIVTTLPKANIIHGAGMGTTENIVYGIYPNGNVHKCMYYYYGTNIANLAILCSISGNSIVAKGNPVKTFNCKSLLFIYDPSKTTDILLTN